MIPILRSHSPQRDPRRGRPAWRGPSRMRALAVAAAVAAGLAGCTALPDAGAPQPFDVSVPNSAPLDLSADGPVPGSSPQALVRDFLLACAAGTTDDFATARQFLTDAAARTWRPDRLVQVYATDASPSFSGGPAGEEGHEDAHGSPASGGDTAEITLSAVAVATVDDRGILTRADADTRIVHDFAIVAQGGEWRIDGLDDGIVVSEASFAGAYQDVSLYFPQTTGDALIADPRWYPSRKLSTHLVTGLLGGPSDSIAPAVASAMPEGATLPSQGVAVTDHVAQVDLSAAFPSDKTVQRLLAWQVRATLTQVSSVSSVELSVSGTRIDADDVPAGPVYALDSAVAINRGEASSADSSGTAEQGAAVLVTGSSVTHVLLPADEMGQDARDPAVSPTADTTIAWLRGNTMSVVPLTSGARVDVPVSSPTAPSVDRWGWAWAASSSAGAGVVAVGPTGETLALDPPFTDTSTVGALRVSPDGARAVVLRVSGSTRSVWVAPILRDADGTPTALGDLVVVPGLASGVLDVSWAGRAALVALRSTASGSGEELATVPLGGFLTTLAVPQDAAEVSGGATPAGVYVTTASGLVFARSGSVWQEVGTGLEDIRYPG